MAKRRIILISASLAAFGIIALFAAPSIIEFIRDPLFEETDTREYPSREEAISQIQLGWLPQLPPSSRSIREKRNIDYGTIVVQFSFSPQEFPSAFPAMTSLDAARARQVGPQWIVRRADWIPAEIRTGRTDALLSQGFQLFRLDEPVGSKSWYLLVHPQRGIAYGWNSNAG
jgi:hypothetical protein